MRVLVLGTAISGLVGDGVYAIDKVSACDSRPPERCVPSNPEVPLGSGGAREALLGDVDAVLLGPGYPLGSDGLEVLRARFEQTLNGGAPQLHLRR